MNALRFGVVTALVLVTSIVCWPLVASSQDSAPTDQNAAVEAQPAGADQQSIARTEALLQSLALAGTVPTELQDPAFDRYVDLALLGNAWADLDASLMTDVALQFMEGERVLMRPHEAIDTDALLEVAIRLAAVRNDGQSLDRLAKASKLRASQSLAAQVAQARQIMAQQKPADPALNIPIESLSPEAFALYKACLLDIDAAVVAQDTHALEVLEQELPTMTSLPEKHRSMLQQKIKTARQSIADKAQEPNAAASILDKLAATTRHYPQETPTVPGGGMSEIPATPLPVTPGGGGTPTYPGNPPGSGRPPGTWIPPITWNPPITQIPPRVPPNKTPYYPPNRPPYYPPYRPPYYPPQQQQQWIPPQPPQPPGKQPPTPPPGKWQADPGFQGGGQFIPEDSFSRRYYIIQ